MTPTLVISRAYGGALRLRPGNAGFAALAGEEEVPMLSTAFVPRAMNRAEGRQR